MTCIATRHGGDGVSWLSAYTGHGCRCPQARQAVTRAAKTRRLAIIRGQDRLVPASGTVLRLRALQAIGWSIRELAEMLGYVDKSSFGPLLYGAGRKKVTAARHQRVKDLYDRMWNTPGTSVRSVRRAQRLGWPLPLDLDDDLIDDPDYRPADNRLDEVTARRQEREVLEERIVELEAKGMSARQISAALGVSDRAVVRRRRAQRMRDAA